MLKLTLKPGEYIDIGENIKVIFSGGSANNIHLLVDAPREVNIVRSSVKKAAGEKVDEYKKLLIHYYETNEKETIIKFLKDECYKPLK